MLPERWLGVWRGSLTLSPPPAGYPPRIPTTLTIAARADGAWTFDTRYDDKKGDDGRGTVKPYVLKAGASPNRFVLDEGNGILLDAYFESIDNIQALYFTFTVGSSLLVSRYELRGAILFYEIRSYKPAPGDALPFDVKAFSQQSVQWAKFTASRRR